ncbi:MAG: CidA/LrgA family protein [Alcaligenaceae bacterium]|nr:CidA/LrgA family protein [Alcaligenaceae bacterium]
MLLTLAILCFFQALGELTSMLSGLPIPGPVMGMVFLVIVLWRIPRLLDQITIPAEQLLRSMMIMFIPVCVGIMTSYTLLKGQWLAVVIAIAVSTILAMVVGALVMQWVVRVTGKRAAVANREKADV